MSLSALLEATRDYLRSELKLADRECNVEPTAQPTPGIGQRYFSVYPTAWEPGPLNRDSMEALDEMCSIAVGITWKVSGIPSDRKGYSTFLYGLQTLEKWGRQVLLAMDGNFDIITAANQIILANEPTSQDFFIESMYWVGSTIPPEPKSGEWIGSTAPDNNQLTAYLFSLYFGGARRIQTPARNET